MEMGWGRDEDRMEKGWRRDGDGMGTGWEQDGDGMDDGMETGRTRDGMGIGMGWRKGGDGMGKGRGRDGEGTETPQRSFPKIPQQTTPPSPCASSQLPFPTSPSLRDPTFSRPSQIPSGSDPIPNPVPSPMDAVDGLQVGQGLADLQRVQHQGGHGQPQPVLLQVLPQLQRHIPGGISGGNAGGRPGRGREWERTSP